MSPSSFKKLLPTNYFFTNHIYLIYMYKIYDILYNFVYIYICIKYIIFYTSSYTCIKQVRQTPEEGWRTHQRKRWGNNNKDEDNSPKTLNDKKKAFLCCCCLRGMFISFAHNYVISATPTKYFNLIFCWVGSKYSHSVSEWTRVIWQWNSSLHSGIEPLHQMLYRFIHMLLLFGG